MVGVLRHMALAVVFTMATSVDGQPDASVPGDRVSVGAKIDEILTRLESRSDSLKDIRCRVRFEEDDRINLTKRVKTGRILFMMVEPNPLFLVHFERTEVDGMVGKQEWYLFDGRWLFEANERIKQITKREWARAGEKIDLFDLETAPFPLPFGQKRDNILKNFDVTLAEPTASDPKNTDHLICIPKQGSTMQGKYDQIEFFVRRDVNLPSRIIVTKNGGLEINTADFPDLSPESIDTGMTKRDLARPKAWKGYEESTDD